VKQIHFYRLNNKSPVEDFLDSLSVKEAQKVLWVLKLVEELDNVSSKYYKKLKNADDIIEVRISLGIDVNLYVGSYTECLVNSILDLENV
jgi:hypothetical protein